MIKWEHHAVMANDKEANIDSIRYDSPNLSVIIYADSINDDFVVRIDHVFFINNVEFSNFTFPPKPKGMSFEERKKYIECWLLLNGE